MAVTMAVAVVALAATTLVNLVQGTCVVESHKCDFPFTRNGETHYSCMGEEQEQEQGATTRYFCFSQIGEKYVSGLCNGGCFEDDGSPSVFNSSIGDDVLAVFCKTDPSPCQFPFIWEGREYRECTSEGSEFPWCAVEVDSAGRLVDGRWGKCDMDTCSQGAAGQHAQEEAEEPRSLIVTLPNLSGELVVSQSSPADSLTVEGQLRGLPAGPYQVSVQGGSCEALEEPSTVLVTAVSNDDGVMSVSAQSWSHSLFEDTLVGKMLVIKGENELSVGEVGDHKEGGVVTCTPITLPAKIDTTLLIIIIAVSLAILILLIIIVAVICCCCCGKRRKEKKKKNDKNDNFDSIDDEHIGNGKARTPLYDELSIPFIDASLPPTPKMGRSTDQLAFLLGNTRGSKSSLSSVGVPVNATPI